RPRRRYGGRRVGRCDLADLPEQVEYLLRRPDEIPGSESGFRQDVFEGLPFRPGEDRGCETRVQLTRELDLMGLLHRPQATPERCHLLEPRSQDGCGYLRA